MLPRISPYRLPKRGRASLSTAARDWTNNEDKEHKAVDRGQGKWKEPSFTGWSASSMAHGRTGSPTKRKQSAMASPVMRGTSGRMDKEWMMHDLPVSPRMDADSGPRTPPPDRVQVRVIAGKGGAGVPMSAEKACLLNSIRVAHGKLHVYVYAHVSKVSQALPD